MARCLATAPSAAVQAKPVAELLVARQGEALNALLIDLGGETRKPEDLGHGRRKEFVRIL